MSPAAGDQKYFLWFSDVHYDPYYSTKDAYRAGYNSEAVCNSNSVPSMGSVGCDSPKALVDSALAHATEVAASPSFIVLSGDSIRHDVDRIYASTDHEGSENRVKSEVQIAAHSDYHSDAMKTAGDIIKDLVALFDSAFPGVEIIFSIGNNDIVPDYYLQLPTNSSNMSLTSEDSGMLGIIYNALQSNDEEELSIYNQLGSQKRSRSLLSAADSATFLKGGYYSRVLPDGLTVLSINTVLYSSFFGPDPLNADDPGEQFAWMRNTLMNIRERGNSQAIVVGHISPSMGSFRHSQLWKEKYINIFYEIIQEFDDVIIGQLFGHLHSDEFRVGTGTSGIPSSLSTPLLLAGSLTPVHGNNPSFRKVFYDGGAAKDNHSYKLLDYESHRYSKSDNNTGDWSKLYTFAETYGTATEEIKMEGLSANVFRSILRSMEDNQGSMSPTFNSFLLHVNSGSEGDAKAPLTFDDCDANCRAEWLCTLSGTTTVSQYNKCLLQKKGSSRHIQKMGSSRLMIGVAGAAMFAAAFLFVMMLRFRNRREKDQYESPASIEGTEIGDDDML